MKDQTPHQNRRIALWVKEIIAVSGANDCKSPETAISWADKVLKAFDERFTPPLYVVKEGEK